MKQEELKEFLSNFGYEETVVFEDPSYDTACVGLTDDGRAVYDYDKMIEHLMEVDGMDADEAADFISYNTIRSLPYVQNSSIIITFFDNMQ